MSTSDSRVVAIIGAGQAGAGVAKGLRAEGFTGEILLFGDEPDAPYERPPLSKAVLAGEDRHLTSTLLSSADAAERAITMHLGTRVVAIDLAARTLHVESKTLEHQTTAPQADAKPTHKNREPIHFDELVFATGGSPRRLGIEDPTASRVFALRNRADAVQLRTALSTAESILVIGGGWIGLEVAATARKLGCTVTVVEAADRICIRSAPEILSHYLLGLHQAHGVSFHLGKSIQSVVVTETGATATLASGELLQADLVIEGVGLLANDQLAREAGIACDGGIPTLPCGKTLHDGVWAVGDVAVFDRPSGMGVGRLESWANANEQAILCARSITRNTTEPYDVSAWFWSDQYGINVQLCGNFPANAELILRGDPCDVSGADGASWSALAMSDGLLIGAVVANDPQSAKAARRLLDRSTPDSPSLRDPNQRLASLLRNA